MYPTYVCPLKGYKNYPIKMTCPHCKQHIETLTKTVVGMNGKFLKIINFDELSEIFTKLYAFRF